MKSLGMLRISIIALGSAAAMSIAPRCSAQSEIDPDHFDGTDSWQAVAVAKVQAPKTTSGRLPLGRTGIDDFVQHNCRLGGRCRAGFWLLNY